MSWVVNFAKLVLGYQGATSYNPFALIISLLIFGVILAVSQDSYLVENNSNVISLLQVLNQNIVKIG
ncbi:hypothetical protein [Lentilactobacillus kisonensis]|uniref:hypothetical protein n=1 Tax=Lentilactobacillus kisonensis TaxID=481722 RepID=UPI001FB4C746|nr:hypothetical protein [Lentilactobacillus kisonensis]